MSVFYHYLIFFLNFWLCWIFVALQWLSLIAVSEVYSLLVGSGFSLWWDSHCGARDSHCGARDSPVVSSLVKHRLYVQGLQWLKHRGSAVVAQGRRAHKLQ